MTGRSFSKSIRWLRTPNTALPSDTLDPKRLTGLTSAVEWWPSSSKVTPPGPFHSRLKPSDLFSARFSVSAPLYDRSLPTWQLSGGAGEGASQPGSGGAKSSEKKSGTAKIGRETCGERE